MAEEALKAEYFVTRNDGRMVPLLAVDELPHHIVIAKVPKVMTAFDIAGMTCIGRSGFRHRHYSVQGAAELVANSQASKGDALKAKYFITRDSGNLVPLIAMDEMPKYFVVEGVPRDVSVFDIAGMTCVGLDETRDRVHVVEDVNKTPLIPLASKSDTEKVDGALHESEASTVSMLETGLSISDRTQYILGAQTDSQVAQSTTPLSETQRAVPMSPIASVKMPNLLNYDPFGNSKAISPPLTNPDSGNASSKGTLTLGMKEYCSYWIRHGECDYQQQGCLYKHEMPLDPETLARLGLRDIPRWYREKHCLGSYLAAGGSGAAFGSQGLRSAAASGLVEDDKQTKMTTNWRTAPRADNFSTPPMGGRIRNNIYNPQGDRFAMGPPAFSRPSFGTPPRPFFENRNVSNMKADHHQQHIKSKVDNWRKHSAYKGPRPSNAAKDANFLAFEDASDIETRSAPSLLSDIEATINREDAARRAKEDAYYKKICEEAEREKAAKAAEAVQSVQAAEVVEANTEAANNNDKSSEDQKTPVVEVKAPAVVKTGEKRGSSSSGGGRRGGRKSNFRGRGRSSNVKSTVARTTIQQVQTGKGDA